MLDEPLSDDAATVAPRQARAVPAEPTRSVPPPALPSEAFPPETVGASSPSTASIDRVRQVLDQGRSAVVRIFVYPILLACLPAIPTFALAPGAIEAKVLGMVALVVLTAVLVSVVRAARRRELTGGSPLLRPLPAVLGVLAGVSINVALGLFAPLPFAAILGLMIVYLGVGSSEREARLLYVLCAVLYGATILLVIAGIVPDIGLFSPASVDETSMWLALLELEFALAFAYVLARPTGRYTQALFDRLDRAIRDAARREALLGEVRADLERAVGIGHAGLFTDLELGSFVLAEIVGRGGMGEVYAATDRMTGRRAAVKLLRREAMSNADAVGRFEREARIAAELDSEHVVEVLEIGGMEAPVPYLAMELLMGEDLGSLLRARSRLSLDDCDELVRQVCQGLGAAHARGIVHRDLKPANLFLSWGPGDVRRWKILDFGVSKLMWGADATLGGDRVVGTPGYMAPEQALSASDVGPRADLYALCVVAYRALTGSAPFANGPAPTVLKAVAEAMPEDPGKLATLPEDVALVLRIGLSKDPSERFETAEALALAFADAVRGELSDELRRHAARLLAAHPWGTRAGSVPTEPSDDDGTTV